MSKKIMKISEIKDSQILKKMTKQEIKTCPKCDGLLEIIKLKHQYSGFKVKIWVCKSCGWRKEKSESLKVDLDNDKVDCGSQFGAVFFLVILYD